MDEDGPRAAEEQDPEEDSTSKTFVRLNDLSGDGGRSVPGDKEKDPGSGDSDGEALPYPALAPIVFFYLSQHSRPRSWCLRIVCNPYPFSTPTPPPKVTGAGGRRRRGQGKPGQPPSPLQLEAEEMRAGIKLNMDNPGLLCYKNTTSKKGLSSPQKESWADSCYDSMINSEGTVAREV
ncbi:Hypothetical predicted protein [Podarcis lilfordi]|uniref:Voltage-dependent T-type calcium channel subunit alpha-1G n=1 Tax=Podarcis lilfordi TaxID=74358 RepID=A0AA35NZB9_9SAUR|nr:Hypothetical predicted protein [Podarcis lilfordi]